MSIKIQKPFLKWAGGKSQIINNVIEKFPKKINNYHEIFLGGGSVLLALLSYQKQGNILIKNNIYAYDINDNLINVYKHIQNDKEELFEYIEKYINEYDNISDVSINRKPTNIEEAKTSKESYYYWLRKLYNTIEKPSVECSALFMIINKLCFRGLYREGPNGFNVPFGHYKTTPTIIIKDELDNISDLIKDVIFIHSDFMDSMKNVKEEDFIYLDPPYAPINNKSFVNYNYDGFDLDNHIILFEEIKKLNSKNIKFVMSNAKVKLIIDNFKDFNSDDIIAKRAINSKNPESKITEVIIYN